MDLQKVFKNNEDWIKGKLQQSDTYFDDLAAGQQPDILYVGCSDSRVTAEEIMGVGPGEIFVTRNVANMVINTDMSMLSVVNYAVQHLKVKQVVVCGHYGCGGVKAGMGNANMGILNPYLREVRDVFRLHRDELMKIEDEDARYNRLVELNVQEQCINMIKTPEVQEARKSRNLEVHGWVFDLKTGRLKDLEIDVDAVTDDIMDIYRMD